MIVLSMKFLGLLAAATLLLFGGGGFQATQGLRCWKCRDCNPETDPGDSVQCTEGKPAERGCYIYVSTVDQPEPEGPKRVITRDCCGDCLEFKKGECIESQVSIDSTFETCFCNDADNCNKGQIAGMPVAGGTLRSANWAIIFFTITTIIISYHFSLD